MRKLLTAMLSMGFLAACNPAVEVGRPPPPPERLVCEGLPDVPDVKPLQAFALPSGVQVYYKADVDARDAQIAPYVIAVRGAWFSCSSQLEWNRDYWTTPD